MPLEVLSLVQENCFLYVHGSVLKDFLNILWYSLQLVNKAHLPLYFSPSGGAPSSILRSLSMWMHHQVPTGSRIVGKTWTRTSSQQFEPLRFFLKDHVRRFPWKNCSLDARGLIETHKCVLFAHHDVLLLFKNINTLARTCSL